jgi:hypothetical protein
MRIFHALREGFRGFNHGYESVRAIRLASESANKPKRSLWEDFLLWIGLDDFLRLIFSAVALIIGLVVTAAVLLIIVAVVKWAYVEVFYR